MKSLRFTIPILLSLCMIFFGQSFTSNSAMEVIGKSINNGNTLAENDGNIVDSDQLSVNELVDMIRINDPYYNQQWGPAAIRMPLGIDLSSYEIRPTLVAVLDTGIDSSHEDLKNKISGEINLTQSLVVGDINGHGTHIAGIIAANTGNGVGIAGISPLSQLLNVKVADDMGDIDINTVIKGIYWAVDNGATVINISIEFTEPCSDLEKAINYAWNKGVVVTAAASNHTTAPVYPAYYSNCLAVASINQEKQLGPLIYDSEWVDAAAPGYSIYSTLPNNEYGFKSGTSFATAYVSGLAALLAGITIDRNANGKINDEIRACIENAAVYTSQSNIRLIDAVSSINKILDLTASIN